MNSACTGDVASLSPPIEADDALLTAGGGRRSGKIDAMEPGAHCSAMMATPAGHEKIEISV
jgi:hypothetical protein